MFTACSDVEFIDKIHIGNPTDYNASVDVRGEGGGWLALTTVVANETRTVEQVIDQGSSWTFRFSYAGHEVASKYKRDALVESGWRLEVPSEFETQLRDAGVEEPP